VISYADGGTATGVCTLAWVATGNATGHLFRLEYSDDSGASWVTVVSNVSGALGGYDWDTSALGTQVLSMWRIVDQDEPDVSDAVTKLFTVRNGPAYYYVNDTERAGDVYTRLSEAYSTTALNRGSPNSRFRKFLMPMT
jgi:hypothetical protein